MHRERSTHPARLGGAGRWWLVVSSLIGGLIGGTAVQAAPGLTVGAIVPQSWPNPTQGEEIILGMQLAIKTWPGQPTAKLIIKDSACKTPTADTAAAELVAARVDMVVGGF
jgi:ABC-type branched-subunit amino acid transport system substrate-binding protein